MEEKFLSVILKELFVELLTKGRKLQLRPEGESMYPFIRGGEVIIAKPIRYEETRIGDILLCQSSKDEKIFIHRLIKKCQNRLIIKGDANLELPYWLPIYSSECVIGKVIVIKRDNRTINLESKFNRMNGYIKAFLSLHLPWILTLQRKFFRAIENPQLVLNLINKKGKNFLRSQSQLIKY